MRLSIAYQGKHWLQLEPEQALIRYKFLLQALTVNSDKRKLYCAKWHSCL